MTPSSEKLKEIEREADELSDPVKGSDCRKGEHAHDCYCPAWEEGYIKGYLSCLSSYSLSPEDAKAAIRPWRTDLPKGELCDIILEVTIEMKLINKIIYKVTHASYWAGKWTPFIESDTIKVIAYRELPKPFSPK